MDYSEKTNTVPLPLGEGRAQGLAGEGAAKGAAEVEMFAQPGSGVRMLHDLG